MTLCDIEVFLTIARLHSVSQAAQGLHLAQSTVSYRLKMLEQELGVELFVRGKGIKTVELTESGEKFIPIAEKWMVLWKDSLSLKESDSAFALAIGSVDSLNSFIFPPLYKKLINNNPAFVLDIQTHHTHQIFDELDNRELDIGFCVWNKPHPNIISEPIFTEKMQIITSRNYGEGTINTSQLAAKDELVLSWGADYRMWHNQYFDPEISVKARIDMVPMLMPLLEMQNVWACVPAASAKFLQQTTDAFVYDLENPPPDRICYKLLHREPKRSRLSAIAIFEQQLKVFLEENELSM